MAGKVEKRMQPQPGRVPLALYNRADLERLTAAEAFPVSPAEATQLTAPAAPARFHPAILAQLFEAAAAMRLLPAPAATPALWLDLAAASAYTGLSAAVLRKLIRKGELPALRDHKAWKLRRLDLDNISARSQGDGAKSATDRPLARSAGGGE